MSDSNTKASNVSHKTVTLSLAIVATMLLSGCGAASATPSYSAPKQEETKPQATMAPKPYAEYIVSTTSEVKVTELEKATKRGGYVPSYNTDIFLTVETNKEIKDSFLVGINGERYDYFSSGFSNSYDPKGNVTSSSYSLIFIVAKKETTLKLVLANNEVLEIDASTASMAKE